MYTRKDKQFMYNIFPLTILKKKKEKPEGCQLLYLLIQCPLMYSSPVWCFTVNICLTDEEGHQMFSGSKCTDIHVPSQSWKEMMKIYSLQGYDEVPRRQLGASVFSVALSRMCFIYSTSFYTLI